MDNLKISKLCVFYPANHKLLQETCGVMTNIKLVIYISMT